MQKESLLCKIALQDFREKNDGSHVARDIREDHHLHKLPSLDTNSKKKALYMKPKDNERSMTRHVSYKLAKLGGSRSIHPLAGRLRLWK